MIDKFADRRRVAYSRMKQPSRRKGANSRVTTMLLLLTIVLLFNLSICCCSADELSNLNLNLRAATMTVNNDSPLGVQEEHLSRPLRGSATERRVLVSCRDRFILSSAFIISMLMSHVISRSTD